MGTKIYPLVQDGVLDVDIEQEMPLAEFWLKKMDLLRQPLPIKKVTFQRLDLRRVNLINFFNLL